MMETLTRNWRGVREGLRIGRFLHSYSFVLGQKGNLRFFTLFNQLESLGFSENALNFSQCCTTEKNSGVILTDI